MDIGTKIKRLRENKNITQTTLANKLGIAQNTLGLIENGDTKKIDFLLMDKICKIFEVDLNYFIDESKYRQVNKPNSTGYLAETQNIQLSDKVIEQLNNLIKDKDLVILELKEIIQQQNEIIKKLNK
ncbi:MAG: helix-turn-helix transcriptional regulator [Flavobacterium sp.]|jgi:transcriptional regulator with XRE-family HTH domain|uniref:helix-turn-helix domain-containing protein n=2 Tax=Flavobacterium sp. TaxID=239 RepID=UPI0022BDB87F|nr:helix-turn-helix transcriptional regulator [Flavobacterium sp.]MCZ8330418.1 helix-turn-helix transcriptional regulator [Flavobacterium sp.]